MSRLTRNYNKKKNIICKILLGSILIFFMTHNTKHNFACTHHFKSLKKGEKNYKNKSYKSTMTENLHTVSLQKV